MQISRAGMWSYFEFHVSLCTDVIYLLKSLVGSKDTFGTGSTLSIPNNIVCRYLYAKLVKHWTTHIARQDRYTQFKLILQYDVTAYVTMITS